MKVSVLKAITYESTFVGNSFVLRICIFSICIFNMWETFCICSQTHTHDSTFVGKMLPANVCPFVIAFTTASLSRTGSKNHVKRLLGRRASLPVHKFSPGNICRFCFQATLCVSLAVVISIFRPSEKVVIWSLEDYTSKSLIACRSLPFQPF